MNPLLLGSLALFGIVCMLAMLRLIDIMLRKPVKPSPIKGRPEKTLKDFAAEAGEARISLRVARETYDVLLEHYPSPMCIDIRDDLRRDLLLSEQDILKIRATLLQKTDRIEPATPADAATIVTVHNLLSQVEGGLRDQIDRATLRLRTTDSPYPVRPAAEVVEFTPLSQVPDPDFFRRAHFKWLRRRISDYKGLRSRAEDDTSKSAHIGPFRRRHEGARRFEMRSVPSPVSVVKTPTTPESQPDGQPAESIQFGRTEQKVTRYAPQAIAIPGSKRA